MGDAGGPLGGAGLPGGEYFWKDPPFHGKGTLFASAFLNVSHMMAAQSKAYLEMAKILQDVTGDEADVASAQLAMDALAQKSKPIVKRLGPGEKKEKKEKKDKKDQPKCDILYCQDKREGLKLDSTRNGKAVMSMLGGMWSSATAEEKKVYQDRVEALREAAHAIPIAGLPEPELAAPEPAPAPVAAAVHDEEETQPISDAEDDEPEKKKRKNKSKKKKKSKHVVEEEEEED